MALDFHPQGVLVESLLLFHPVRRDNRPSSAKAWDTVAIGDLGDYSCDVDEAS